MIVAAREPMGSPVGPRSTLPCPRDTDDIWTISNSLIHKPWTDNSHRQRAEVTDANREHPFSASIAVRPDKGEHYHGTKNPP